MFKSSCVALCMLCLCSVAFAVGVSYEFEIWGYRRGVDGRVYFGTFDSAEAAFRAKEQIENADTGNATDKPYDLKVYRITVVNGVRRPIDYDNKMEKPPETPWITKETPKPGNQIPFKPAEIKWFDPGEYKSAPSVKKPDATPPRTKEAGKPDLRFVDPGPYNSPFDKSEKIKATVSSTSSVEGQWSNGSYFIQLGPGGKLSGNLTSPRNDLAGTWKMVGSTFEGTMRPTSKYGGSHYYTVKGQVENDKLMVSVVFNDENGPRDHGKRVFTK